MLVAAKTYALISEYALICDMRLITREYGIYIHLVASVQSIYNSTIIRSNRLVIAAIDSSSRILADVFCESLSLTYTSCGYNCLYGPKHTKSYNEAESLCASFIRDVRMSPSLNTALLGEINHMCTV